MSFLKYPKYKDSGIRWLGAVPEHWVVKPLWTFYRRNKRTGFEDEELLSVYRDFGVIPKSSRHDNFNKPSEDLGPYQLVRPSDLVINKMKAWQGSVAVSEYRGIVSPAYFVCESLHEENSRFLHYLMRSPRYITGYLSNSKGIRVNQWDLEPQRHTRMPLLVPPRGEQATIASFLDAETSKIDALVAEQRRLIALLKEKRQAVISHAVTKGLNPNAPMKPSGIQWLGDVPEHWSLPPLYARYEAVLGKMLDQNKMTGEYPAPYVRNVDVQWDQVNTDELPVMDIRPDERERFTIRNGDLLICEGGEVGRTAIWQGEDNVIAFQKAIHRLRPCDDSENSRFFFYTMCFSTGINVFIANSNPNTIPHLTGEQLHSYRFPKPPVHEQSVIAEFLDEQTVKLDLLMTEAEQTIELLRERRAALISAAVTGKIDVREFAYQESE